MRKALYLLMAAVLISGCSFQGGISPNEKLTDTDAYVVGKLARHTGGGSLAFIYVNAYANANNIYAQQPGTRFSLRLERDDIIQKVAPGIYVVECALYGASDSKGAIQLGTVQVEAGKINYIGTFDVAIIRITPPGAAAGRIEYKVASDVVSYQPEAVKTALKQTYPHLAGEIDSKFSVSKFKSLW